MSFIIGGDKALYNVFQDAQVSERQTWIAGEFVYNIHPDIFTQTLVDTGTVSVLTGNAVLSSGAGTSASSHIQSVQRVIYTPGQETWCFFTAIFTPGVAGSYQRIGLFGANEGYAIGYNGADFCVMRKTGGIWSILATQANFSEDRLDGTGCSAFTLDKTKGNIFKISYGYLGYAPTTFWVFAGNSAGWVKFHVYDYPNTAVRPHILQTSIPWAAEVGKTSGATNIVLKSASIAAGTSGNHSRPLDLHYTARSSKTGIGTTAINLITIKSATAFASIANEIFTYLHKLDLAASATSSNRVLIWDLRKNAALGGTPSFTNYDTDRSPISYDVAGTTVTGGVLLLGGQVFANSNEERIFTQFETPMLAGDTITLSVRSSTGTMDADAVVMWVDRF